MRLRIARLLILAGSLLLAFRVAAMAHRAVFGELERRAFLARLGDGDGAVPRERDPDTREWDAARMAAYVASLAGPPGAKPLAVLEIPRLDLSVLVLDGIDEWSLNRGVGRIPGTAEPPAGGNLGIAGHRDGFFRALRDIVPGDVIDWRGPDGVRRYEVAWTRVVRPEDVDVLAPTDAPALTLVTCHPFYYVGAAPERFVVRARLVGDLAALASSSPPP